jgi:hypothetical protein
MITKPGSDAGLGGQARVRLQQVSHHGAGTGNDWAFFSARFWSRGHDSLRMGRTSSTSIHFDPEQRVLDTEQPFVYAAT